MDFAIFRVEQFVSGLPVMRLIQRYPILPVNVSARKFISRAKAIVIAFLELMSAGLDPKVAGAVVVGWSR